jgi:hypothetical protein
MEQSPKIEREDIRQRMRKSNWEREREGKREGGGETRIEIEKDSKTNI